MITEERTRALIGDMSWIVSGLSDEEIEDLYLQILAYLNAAVADALTNSK